MRIFKNITRIFSQLSWNSKKESQVNKKDNFLDLNINMQNSRFKQNFMINEAISILSKSGYHENQVVFHIRYFTQQCLKKYSVRIFLWNSLCNKYAKCSEVFSPPQAIFFLKFFALCDVILGIDNISFDNSM